MADPSKPATNFAAWLNQHLAMGESVFIADNNHLKPQLPQMVATDTIQREIRYAGATLILEGPQAQNAQVEALQNNTLNAATFRQQGYAGGKKSEADRAHEDILINAVRSGTRVFFPERGTAYEQLARDQPARELFSAITQNTPADDCSEAGTEDLLQRVPENLRHAMGSLNRIVGARDTSEENANIVQGIVTQPGPHVIVYGAAHLAPIREHMNVTAIAFLESPQARYQGKLENLPEYIYFASEDRVEHIPVGSPERQMFIDHHTGPGTKPGEIGIPMSDAERQACLAPARKEEAPKAQLLQPVAP